MVLGSWFSGALGVSAPGKGTSTIISVTVALGSLLPGMVEALVQSGVIATGKCGTLVISLPSVINLPSSNGRSSSSPSRCFASSGVLPVAVDIAPWRVFVFPSFMTELELPVGKGKG